MAHALLELLSRGPVLLDGGMGTLLQSFGGPVSGSLEMLNLTDPGRVQMAYKRYIEAGSRVIYTNSYNANARGLGHYGAADKVRDVNRKAARLAREVRELQGTHTLVAGSVGPLGEHLESTGLGALTAEAARALYRAQMAALVEGGVDLLVIETQTDLTEALLALETAKALCDLPVLVTMTFDDDGRTALGQTAAAAARALAGAGATAVGANCGSGPRGILRAVREMAAAAPGALLVAKPNAGWPHRVNGRLFFQTTTEYAGGFAQDALAAGARLIGGCCGMGPEHVAAMGAALEAAVAAQPLRTPAQKITVAPPPAPQRKAAGGYKPSALAARLQAGEFVLSMEVHPPRTHLTGAFLRAARDYKEAGVEFVNVVDSPMARVRMSSTLACALLQERVGLETVAHVTPRDRTLLGLQSELIGAHALGVRSILCVTGDPHSGSMAPGTVNVYDVDAIGMIRMLAGYNRGVDPKGNDIGQPAHFLIGGALNPNAPDLGLEMERFHKKIEAGIHFAMVQPVFDIDILVRLLDRLGRPPVPVIAGICPVHSYQHALLLHNEIPGIRLTDAVLERMRKAEATAEQEGLAIARELLAAARSACQGAYIMPSYGRHEAALKVIRG